MSQRELMYLSPDKCGGRSETEAKKLCTDCKTAKTPMWRYGPHGPKSLCNACGIKFRKKNGGGGAVMGLNKESDGKKKKPSTASSTSTTATTATATATATADCSGKKGNDGNTSGGVNRGKNGKLGSKMKVRLMGLGKEVVLLKRPRSPMKRQRSYKKLGEVEQAALLLMALSCDFAYAWN